MAWTTEPHNHNATAGCHRPNCPWTWLVWDEMLCHLFGTIEEAGIYANEHPEPAKDTLWFSASCLG